MEVPKIGWPELTAAALTLCLSSVGGVAAHLYAGKPRDFWMMVAAFAKSAVAGVVAFCIMFHVFVNDKSDSGDVLLLVGFSSAAGMGGIDIAALAMMFVKGKIKINIGSKDKGADDE